MRLQWGRGVTPRIYAAGADGGRMPLRRLQWGRGVTPRIYRQPLSRDADRLAWASMGPRSHSADLPPLTSPSAALRGSFNGAAESLRGSTLDVGVF
ncbi:protein of unknown function [Kyrpidia spormannii]|uniref:Uncharacterized protein n=1 Tax=Kyrpidia spormannii TaxID=2055160 RepID=A0ACA8ZCS2_9BACL|nr:protein of unknown function [Kyrpidia spormannii]